MTSCAYCHHRKGKRPCPALGGLICSPCCGAHRMTRISCPNDCVYLDSGSDYQQQRLGEQFSPLPVTSVTLEPVARRRILAP